MDKLPKTHELKCWPCYFEKVADSSKPFELRKNDRDFKVGDIVILKEFDPDTNKYLGREFKFTISYVLESPRWLRDGVCALGMNTRQERDEVIKVLVEACRRVLESRFEPDKWSLFVKEAFDKANPGSGEKS